MLTTRPMRFTWLLAGLLPLLACSHDSQRDNPLDPELTPAVELQVAVDDTAGAASLNWTPYRGEAPFAAYWVLRALQASDIVDTLATIIDLSQNSYVDSTSLTGLFYSYRISVVNAAGLEVSSTAQSVPSLSHPHVEILDLSFESSTASATLRWSPYTGARFKSYRILRRADNSPPEAVAEFTDIATTSAVDDSLIGNTRYQYEVVVLTDLDEEVASEELGGILHALVDTWPLDMEDGEYVRLYKEDDRVLALISGVQRVRLLSFTSDGLLLEEQVLLDQPFLDITPHASALAFLPDGTRFLAVFTMVSPFGDRSPQLLAYDADGLPLPKEYPVDHEFASFGPSATEVEGQIIIDATNSSPFTVDNVRLTSGDRLLLFDEFDRSDLGEWEIVTGSGVSIVDGKMHVPGNTTVRRKVTASWHDIRLEADIEGAAAIIVQADTLARAMSVFLERVYEHTSFAVGLGYHDVVLASRLMILPPLDSGLLPAPAPSIWLGFGIGVAYHPIIDIDAGLVSTSIVTHHSWPTARINVTRGNINPVSLVALDEGLALTVADTVTKISPGFPNIKIPMDHPVSEMRIWESASGPQLGVCIPDQHRLLYAPTELSRVGYIDWPFLEGDTPLTIGTDTGQDPGAFFYPLSFDVGTDGRIFVLDAGNRRIQAFDSEGNYITQWGSRGAADGQFDFLNGPRPQEFSGSLIVDDDGFIYIADVGNKRIQKFAP